MLIHTKLIIPGYYLFLFFQAFLSRQYRQVAINMLELQSYDQYKPSKQQKQYTVKIPKQIPEIRLKYSFRVEKENRVQIRTSEDSWNALRQIWDKDTLDYREMFIALYLNRCNQVLGYRIISIGGVAGTVVDVKQILAIAVKANASSIVLAHNHPSGQLSPSQQDIDLTRKIKEGGKLLDILVLDHLILTSDYDYFSFADEGYL